MTTQTEEYIALKNYNTPQGGLFKVVVDHYWLVNDKCEPLVHKGRRGGIGLQCNRDYSLIEALCKEREYRFFPVVFVPISVDNFDYAV